MTGGTADGASAGGDPEASSPFGDERRQRAAAVVSAALADRDAAAFVHAGFDRDPGLRYCVPTPPSGPTAVAYDGTADEW
ncbi:hypothetical protein HTG_14465, partial [Natrinema mahii]